MLNSYNWAIFVFNYINFKHALLKLFGFQIFENMKDNKDVKFYSRIKSSQIYI